jgi:hypothetical protein
MTPWCYAPVGGKGKRVKNPDLCQKAFCRKPWAYALRIRSQKWYTESVAHFCVAHAREYLEGERRDPVGNKVSIHQRKGGSHG